MHFYIMIYLSIILIAVKFFRKNISLQEFLFEPDVVNQISSHGWCKACSNKKDVDKEKKRS